MFYKYSLQSLDLQVNVCMKHGVMEDCAQFLLALSDGAGACQVFYLLKASNFLLFLKCL